MPELVQLGTGTWGRKEGRHYDLLHATPGRWQLVRGAGGWDCRQRVLVHMGKEEGLALLLAWGFPCDVIWQADKMWLPKSVVSPRKSLTIHKSSRASNLLPRPRALSPFSLGG